MKKNGDHLFDPDLHASHHIRKRPGKGQGRNMEELTNPKLRNVTYIDVAN